MKRQGITLTHATSGAIWTAIWLLVGILLVGDGFIQQQTIALYAGVLVTLAGVLNAMVRLIVRGKL